MVHCVETSAYKVRTKSRSQSRHELLVPEERKSSGEPGAACLRLGRAHQRSHQRSRSAHSHHAGPQAPERKISAFNSEIAKPLQAQFQVRWLEDYGEKCLWLVPELQQTRGQEGGGHPAHAESV